MTVNQNKCVILIKNLNEQKQSSRRYLIKEMHIKNIIKLNYVNLTVITQR